MRFRRNPSESRFANKEMDTGRSSYSPSGMFTCIYTYYEMKSFHIILKIREGKNCDMFHACIRRKSNETWQNPDTPDMDSKLKALARKVSSVVGSVCSFGGGPGIVGITRTPKSW